jgi:hypothetical protein
LDADLDGNVDAGETITNGAFVSVADIDAGRLKFRSADQAFGSAYASFQFSVRDDGLTTNGGQDTDQSPNVMTIDVNEAFRIEGNILEDINGDSDISDAIAVDGVTVSLYQDTDGTAGISAGDAFVSSTTTNSGSYSFFGLTDDTYFVVVDSSTIGASAGYNSGYSLNDVWAEQTFGVAGAQTSDGAGGTTTLASDGAAFGGRFGGVSDDASSLLTAEHITVVSSSAGNDLANIDSAFSFNVVTGTNDSGQGTFRSFIDNANAIAGDNSFINRRIPDRWRHNHRRNRDRLE